MLHSTQGALLSLGVCSEGDVIQVIRGEMRDFTSLFQREEMSIAVLLSGLAFQIRSWCPVTWRQCVRKGNSSQREISALWELMPKALIVFDETL